MYQTNYAHDFRCHSSYTVSPSASASSTPPSPRRILPPIQHLSSAHHSPDESLWKYRDAKLSSELKRPCTQGASNYYGESPTSSGSPPVLPPLLPHLLGEQAFPRMSHVQQAVPYPAHTMGVPRNKNAWKEHAQLVKLPDGQTEWQCIWRVGNTGEVTDFCGYTAKRHLVKRHIETRHLQFK